ncbi:MAG: AAA family ATPase [Anaerolineae bacterium]
MRVKNYRSLADVDVNLGPLTVLVGPNGSGKSNFVDVLRFVSEALRLGLDSAIIKRGGITSIRRWSPRRPYDIEISLNIEEENFRGEYALSIGSKAEGAYHVKREFCEGEGGTSFLVTKEGESIAFERRDGEWIHYPERLDFFRPRKDLPVSSTALVLPIISQFSPFRDIFIYLFREMSFYTIFPNVLREPQKPLNDYPLNEHGENLASVLRKMRQDKNPWLPDLKEALGMAVEGITDIEVRQTGGYLVIRFKHEGEEEKTHFFDAAQESDGTLRILGLLVALYQDPPRSLITMEEPELTVHPGAMGILCDVIREASQRTQIVLTTHSPDLISRFDPASLRVVEMVQGVTKIGEVDEAQLRAVKERLFSPGGLLRIEGLRRQAEEPAMR